MWKIDLIQYHSLVNVEQRDGQTLIFCTVRGKWLKYQQEELVRQLIIQYLITEQNIRKLSIVVEKSTGLKGQDRIDIAVLNRGGKPLMLIECKTWTERVNQSVLNQISRYNNQLKYPYCWVSTGIPTLQPGDCCAPGCCDWGCRQQKQSQTQASTAKKETGCSCKLGLAAQGGRVGAATGRETYDCC